MAIVENKATEIGDVMIIKADVPILGLTSLIDYLDSVNNVTGTRYFTKEFRYSSDGINWYDWQPLTNLALQAITLQSQNPFLIEYRYTRAGSDPSGELEFENVVLHGTITPGECGPAFGGSIFAMFFDCCCSPELLLWCLNVLEKMYKRGIVPNYMERGKNNNLNWEDEDYIAFWSTVCCYFSLFVNYARKFEKFYNTPLLLNKYLQSKGLYICENDITHDDALYLMEHFYDEVRQRGTLQISVPKSGTKPVDGELLRLICKGECDEFLFSVTEPWKVGWNIGNSSPLYKGTNFAYMLNKAYENTQDFIDLSLYPLVNDPYIGIVTDSGREVMRIENVPIGTISGIQGSSTGVQYKPIVINPSIDYEITFLVKTDNRLNSPLTFEVLGMDCAGNIIQLEEIDGGGDNSTFFQQIILNQDSRFYLVRGIIYSQFQSNILTLEKTLNIGYGQHLRFKAGHKKIIPAIYLDSTNDNTNDLEIWDVKVRPLRTNYSTGFIQMTNFIQTWMQNNNAQYTEVELNDIIREFLIPYDSIIYNNYLN